MAQNPRVLGIGIDEARTDEPPSLYDVRLHVLSAGATPSTSQDAVPGD